MIELPVRSLLVVVSAPSGGGKTTLCERLLGEFHQMVYSVSCTTRAPRDGETDGTDYYFISDEEFERRVQANEFVEHATVHGHRYGTLRRFIERGFASGRDVLMDIDVQGAEQIRASLASLPPSDPLCRGFVDVFIAPPSIDVLRKRLHLRGKDADAVIERRLQQAENELQRWREYRYLIVNDRLDASYDALRAIIVAEHHRLLNATA
ncbi:MAG TPA: guanylate kinase [Kiritimatiellia bacterium]|nr:guanylate kinase [Kiritimatiellia bacterium]